MPDGRNLHKPGSFYRNHEEEHIRPRCSCSYMSRDINRERDFHRFGFQFAGVKYRLVNEVRPLTQNP